MEKEMATHSGTLAWKIPWTQANSFPLYNFSKPFQCQEPTVRLPWRKAWPQ